MTIQTIPSQVAKHRAWVPPESGNIHALCLSENIDTLCDVEILCDDGLVHKAEEIAHLDRYGRGVIEHISLLKGETRT
jgi:hypothetical protein